MNNQEHLSQTVVLTDRSALSVSGTEDVISFDDRSITLRTALGVLHVDGDDLRILSLNGESAGSLQISGRIAGLFFEDELKGQKSRFGRKKIS